MKKTITLLLVLLLLAALTVSAAAAESMAARAAKQWGIAPGPSGGANLVAAFALAQRQELRGKTVATVLPDSMERYR